jgi:hypothetical protein
MIVMRMVCFRAGWSWGNNQAKHHQHTAQQEGAVRAVQRAGFPHENTFLPASYRRIDGHESGTSRL